MIGLSTDSVIPVIGAGLIPDVTMSISIRKTRRMALMRIGQDHRKRREPISLASVAPDNRPSILVKSPAAGCC
ncbi:hypothetical protein XH99_19765 [Bradyrhizobium nanningense]|uniref:Uncharacterized protein n=1 Tax=Bradyrhizobium nanningense TaxID=1325118 RepID=A0A4Q0S221_9BRAD|nr:hypothetical protein [Bradyrhizobium nanningense]RXH21919.1 hypothetical protein XH84_36040 [Bradyrhizobium nanningense]RXH26598.1 hypothetical protein XH99_19765 [Bradyrhizobium nanningense]